MKRKIITGILLAASIILIGIGLIQQQHISMLQKAIRICLECVGIG